jgi:hypothetical protein
MEDAVEYFHQNVKIVEQTVFLEMNQLLLQFHEEPQLGILVSLLVNTSHKIVITPDP